MYEPTDENVFYVVGRYLYECKYFCPDAHEIMSMPIHMTEEIGKYVVIKYYVDVNHTGNMVNMTSHSGIIIYVNNVPIVYYSKCQKTVGASGFGSDFFLLGFPQRRLKPRGIS